MDNKKRTFRIPALLIFMAMLLALGGYLFWRGWMRPKIALTGALQKTFTQLETRFRQDPLFILVNGYAPDGLYTAEMDLAIGREPTDSVQYDMTVQLDCISHRLQADGNAGIDGQETDLSIYLDPDFIALASQTLAGDTYYGITFDSFTADVQKIPLLNYIVNDTLMSKWEASLETVRTRIRTGLPVPALPTVSYPELKKPLLSIAALPCEHQKAEIVVNDVPMSCDRLDYVISRAQLPAAFSQFMAPASADAVFSFYLYGDSLVRIAVADGNGDTGLRCCLDLGVDPILSPLKFQGRNGTGSSLSATVTTLSTAGQYAESWDIQAVSNGIEQDHSFAFDWDPENGNLNFRSGMISAPLALNLRKTADGFRLETDDFGTILRILFRDATPAPSNKPVSCVLNITRGGKVTTPVYKNLDQWSMEDFLKLLGSVGTVVGIKLE